MNTAESSKENSASTNRDHDTENQDISSFAQDALKEVLGWYGLQESERRSHSPEGSSSVTHSSTGGSPSLSTGDPGHGLEDDGDRAGQARDFSGTCGAQGVDNLGNCVGSSFRSRSGSSRKLIGMRYLFPPLGDDLSLLDKARIWVARHDHKYFVGWSEAQLSKIDPVLRPLSSITSQLYKLHMNRSEFCRNVKLKYCLESDTDWAEEFRQKLAKSSADGGFSGLCQAKIAAAELWRKYSDKYKSHQARYPNPKSREQRARGLTQDCWQDVLDTKRMDSGGEDEPPNKRTRAEIEAQEEDCCAEVEDEDTEEGPDRSVDTDSPKEDKESASFEPLDCSKEDAERRKVNEANSPVDECEPDEYPDEMELDAHTPTPSSTPASMSSPATPQSSGLPPHLVEQMQAGMSPYGLPAGLRVAGMPPGSMAYGFDPYMDVLMQFPHMDPRHVGLAISHPSVSGSDTTSTLTRSKSTRSLHNSRSSDYKRSERGLSYLFPSLSEHNLSLLDKVKVTVMRHKNNYFLDWTEEQLSQVDPLIRPKMVVTAELYKEYCHRNAMKYDSNLQFAMESPEQWAQDFRAKLMKPPSHGGFSSLCEVKLEAGRLWRQFSGKYRMHNIVKWHMDLNSATATVLPPPNSDDRATDVTVVESPPKEHTENLKHSKRKSLSSPSLHTTSKECLQTPTPKVPNEPPGCSDRAKVHSRLKQRVDSRSSLLESKPSTQVIASRSDKDVRSVAESVVDHNENSVHTGHLHTDQSKLKGGKSSVDSSQSEHKDGHFNLSHQDYLFRPLPKYLSVFDQVCIWLERHRHNYFLGYPSQKLSEIPEIVRPQMMVTEEVFKRYVPESMVDVISKIDLMISCDTGWSRDFQDKLQRGREEGGFATFEEALTEAVMVWESSQARLLASGWLRDARNDPNTHAHGPRVQEASSEPLNLDGSINKKGKSGDKKGRGDSGSEVSPARDQGNELSSNPSKSSPRSLSVVDPAVRENASPGGDPSQRATSSNSSHAGGMQSKEPHITAVLWACRGTLQQLCEENPSQSWHRRMQPFLPTLQRHLGADYACPNTASDCLVDLVLSVLQQELDQKY